MSETASTTLPPRFRFQWNLTTWFFLVAILGWILAIGPRQIVITDTRPIPGGKPSVSTLTYLNPHYFGPLLALSAFASWKEIAGLPGFRQPAFRRRAKRFALGLCVFSIAVALAAMSVLVPYRAVAGGTVASRPDSWARFVTATTSMACYSALGLAIGLIVALMLSAADHAELAANS